MKTNRGTRKVMSTIIAAAIVCTMTFGSANVHAYADEDVTTTRSAVHAVDVAMVEADVMDSMQEIALNVQMNTEDSTEDKWDLLLMADVEDSLNVRKSASKDSKVVGKLYKGSLAHILEKGEKWTLIQSGNVKGYVLNEYCLTGDDAKALAKKTSKKVAKVTTGTLRIREKASESAKVISLAAKGEILKVSKSSKAKDGWVAVKYQGKVAYVSSEYVKVKTKYTKALTVKEEQEKLAKEAAQQAALEASSASTSASGSSTTLATQQKSAVKASASDAELLGALIYIEAGTGNYQGQLAVGAVVMNRVKSSSYPSSIRGVIYQSGQFATGRINSILASGVPSSCLKAAKAAISGQDNTGGKKSFRSAKSGHAGTNIGGNVFF